MATAAIIAIEDGAGTDAATVTASTTVGASANFTLTSNATFDENEDICVNVTTSAGAAASHTVVMYFLMEE